MPRTKEQDAARQQAKRMSRTAEGLCPECGKTPPEEGLKVCSVCREKRKPVQKKASAKRNQDYRKKVLDNYGHMCVCCGETIEDFLTIDHIEGRGNEHRRELGKDGKMLLGASFYRWLIKEGFPDGFQTLCYNCNNSKHRNKGKCFHQIARDHEEMGQ